MAGKSDAAATGGGSVSRHDRGIAGGRTGQGWLDGLFRPVHYARNRDGYRPPPALYRRLSRRLGPAATSLGLVPDGVITLEVPGRRSGVIRRTTLVRVARDGGVAGHYPVFRIEYGGDAFTRTEEIASGVYRVPTGRGLTGANVYLIRSGPGWVLIDTAWPGRGRLIRAAAESVFGAGTRPAAIVLTHIHPDHSGSALELARMWDLPVYVHPDEMVLAPGGYLPEYGNPLDHWLIAPLLRLLPRRAVESSRARASLEGTARAFDPAAGVPGLPDWQAVPTPGHTPGHVAFFRSRDRVLITGDAVLTVNLNSLPGLLSGRRQVAGPPYISTWNWPVARESVAALARLRPDVLACGHGRPVTGPRAAAGLASCSSRLSGEPGARRPGTTGPARRFLRPARRGQPPLFAAWRLSAIHASFPKMRRLQ